MSPSGIDESFDFADPKAAKAAGVQVASLYLSWDPSKNVTAAKVRALHAVGIGVLLNWESQAGAPLAGGAKGKTDATEAVRQARAVIAEVGHPPSNRLAIYFSCDTDVNSSQYVMIDAYYRQARAVCHAAGFDVGVYGEADLVTHLHRENITDAEWQTYAWSRGVQSPDADFYQYQNGQRLGGAAVDFDRVIHPAELGAWWPPGSPHDTGDDMPLTPAEIEKVADAVWAKRLTAGDGTNLQAGTRLIRAQQISPTALTAALKAAGVTASEDAVKAALTSVLGSLDNGPAQ
jgi:hypothetical protein